MTELFCVPLVFDMFDAVWDVIWNVEDSVGIIYVAGNACVP